MPKLRRHRRDHRARAPKHRKRRNLVKFIPEGDSDFALTSRNFVWSLQRGAEIYHVTEQQIAEIDKAVTAYRDALSALLQARYTAGQSPRLRMRKDSARKEAERVVRTWGNIIRADPRVSESQKKLLRIKIRPERLGKRKCPKSPPRLEYAGSGDGVVGGIALGSGSGIHVLKFFDCNESVTVSASSEVGRVRRAKPDGAVRVELFFDMIPQGQAVPTTPFERGWPKYLRSFSRSPMEVEFPIPAEPMLFVYWARWADSSGEVSRWSKPCVARVEGWTATPPAALPDAEPALSRRIEAVQTKYVFIQTPIAGELPEARAFAGDELREQIEALGTLGGRGGQRMLDHKATYEERIARMTR